MAHLPPLPSLPDDILLLISLHLSVPEILALKQTCRVLHACGSSDYLWHQIPRCLLIPLDLPPGMDLRSFSGPEIQQVVVKGLRLEHNWRKPTPHIKSHTPIQVRDGRKEAAIDEMQLLAGANVLVTAQRIRRNGSPLTPINLWSLEDVRDVYRAASVEISGQYRKFAAALRQVYDTATCMLAITTYAGEQIDNILQVYEIPLLKRSQSEYGLHQSVLRRKAFVKPPGASGIVHDVTIHGDLVAAMFIDFDADHPGHSFQLFLVNTKTWAEELIHPKFIEPINRLSIKLSPSRILLIGATTDTIVVREIDLPQGLATAPDRSFQYRPTEDAADFVQDLGYLTELSISSCPKPIDSDTLIFHSVTMPDMLSLLFFDLQDAMPGRHGHLVRLFFGGASTRQDRAFPLRAETSVKLVRIGATGRRAVWVEHNWETDESRVMRAHFPPEDPLTAGVSVLVPPHPNSPALPFTPRACQSLAFDETTGRLCCGLFNGDIWILDYN